VVLGEVEEVAGETAGDVHVGQRLHLGVGSAKAAGEDGQQLAGDARRGVEEVVEVAPVDDQELDRGDREHRGGARP